MASEVILTFFSFFSLSHARDKLNIQSFLFLSELNINHISFFIITHRAFDTADLSSMQDTCHNERSKYDLARHESPSSSVVRAPDRCTGGHGFEIPSGTQIFSLSHARDKLNIPSFLFLSELNIYHLSFFIITHGAFDIADPSSMQDTCHNELSKYDLARHAFSFPEPTICSVRGGIVGLWYQPLPDVVKFTKSGSACLIR